MDRRTYRLLFWGISLLSCAMLMLEISLTRLFSVVMLYHMSLVSVSMTMFGLTLGGLFVHWFPRFFEVERVAQRCRTLAIAFGLSVILSLWLALQFRFHGTTLSGKILLFIVWTAIIAFPPILNGIAICALLTRFPKIIGKMYAADLAGASLGCLITVWALGSVDTPSAILLVSAFAFLAAYVFAQSEGNRSLARFCLILLLGALLVTAGNARFHFIRIKTFFGKTPVTETVRHEFWNAFSYVRVSEPFLGRFYWGPGRLAPLQHTPQDLFLRASVDIQAGTPIMNFSGNWHDIDWLLYDVTNLVHHIRKEGRVLVIGSGGGRDVLAALIAAEGKREVQGVDINPFMTRLVTEIEAPFLGEMANLPGVNFATDEARSWLARRADRYQVITIPMVDTYAASSTGAFALTENSLYTVEAFRLFLAHLESDGILSVSRWWTDGLVGESHRLVRLASEALSREGVSYPVKHLLLSQGMKVATLLISKTPFSAEDLKHLERVHQEHGFIPLLTPYMAADKVLAAVSQGQSRDVGSLDIPVEVSAPTDDRPFFFQSYRFSWFLKNPHDDQKLGVAHWDKESTLILVALTLVVTVLALLVVFLPLTVGFLKNRRAFHFRHAMILLYFAMIGLGFMLFESAQMQRLNIFLGYPIFSLTVVLFSLLNFSAWGAYIAGKRLDRLGLEGVPFILVALAIALVATGLASKPIVTQFASLSTPLRILIAILLTGPAGFFMGMLFPVGIRMTETQREISLAWVWAINGITSTCAAIYAIGLSITFGFTATYWSGLACYALAGLSALLLTSSPGATRVDTRLPPSGHLT